MADNRGDLGMLEALVNRVLGQRSAHLDEATVLHFAGTSGLSGDYQGRRSVEELFHRMDSLTKGTMRFRQWKTIPAGRESVLLRGYVTASRSDRAMGSDLVFIMTLQENRISEIWMFHLDQAQVDRFWMES